MNRIQIERIIAEAKDMLIDAEAAQRFSMAERIENMAFYRGYQVGHPTQFGIFSGDDWADGEEREVRNYIATTVTSLVAQRLRARPSLKVTASSSDIKAQAAARIQERIIRSMSTNGVLSFEEFYRGEVNRAISGAVWYKTYWDPNRGRPTRKPRFAMGPSGETIPVLDAFGAQKWWHAFEGEVAVEQYSTADVLPDPLATKTSEIRHIFHRKLVAISTALDRFPYDAFGRRLGSGDFDQDQSYYEFSVHDAIENDSRRSGVNIGGSSPAQAGSNHLAKIVDLWIKPTNESPAGALIVFSGDTVLAASPLPYEWPWDLSVGRHIVPSSLYADGDVRHLKSPQRAINLIASKIKEYIANCVNPALLAPEGSNVTPGDFSDIAGDVITFDATSGEPKWMSPPIMPGEVSGEGNRLVGQMGDIAAVSDITRGNPPPGIETGRGLAFLYEFNAGAHEPDVAMQNEVYRSIASKAIKLIHAFYEEGRLISLVGDNSSWEVLRFSRADMGEPQPVVIETEDQEPNSRAIRRAEALENFQLGVYEDTPAAERYRKAVGMPHFGPGDLAVEKYEMERALEEQTGIIDGIVPVLLEQDDDEFHLQSHHSFVSTPEFRGLPQPYQQAFLAHVAEHEERYVEVQQAEMAMQAPQGGANSQGSPPARPQLPSPLDGGRSDIEALRPGGEPPTVAQVARRNDIPTS